MMALHRVRSLLIRERTALMNEMRGLLAECGVIAPLGPNALRQLVASVMTEADELISGLLREVLSEMNERLRLFEDRLKGYDRRIAGLAQQDERATRLIAVPGVGPLTATALVAATGNARQFRSGRELSAWLGLVPRQHSSGERVMLLGISKRGDRYLRTLLIHGARTTLRYVKRRCDLRSRWVARLSERRGPNIAAVALANKNTRVLWALLTRDETYRSPAAA
jgi:transposase